MFSRIGKLVFLGSAILSCTAFPGWATTTLAPDDELNETNREELKELLDIQADAAAIDVPPGADRKPAVLVQGDEINTQPQEPADSDYR